MTDPLSIAASVPTVEGAPHFAGAFGHRIDPETATDEYVRAVIDQMRLQEAILDRYQDISKVAKALELVRQARDAGEKVLVFTSLRGLYKVLEKAFRWEHIPYTGMDGVPTQKRNGVIREFGMCQAF